MKSERFDIQQHITDQIIAAIESGAGLCADLGSTGTAGCLSLKQRFYSKSKGRPTPFPHTP